MSLAAGQLEPFVLATARYGKDKVRVCRVVGNPESNVTVLVEGARRQSRHVLKYIWHLVSLQPYARGQYVS